MNSDEIEYPAVVSVVNLKGGVGKTTLCVNLAYGLAYFLDKRILLIDLDPQANATQYLLSQSTYKKVYLSETPQKKTIVEVLDEFGQAGRSQPRKRLKKPEHFLQRIHTTKSKGYLDLLASKIELSLLSFASSTLPVFDQVRWFVQSVTPLYDIVLIDCPPTVSSMLIAGFEAAQFILVPIKPDFLSTIGLPLLNQVIHTTYTDYVKRASWLPELSMLGLVYNMCDPRLKMTRESMEDVQKEAEKLGYPIFRCGLSYSTKFTWSSKLTLPIFRTEPSSRYAREIEDLVNEFDRRLTKHICKKM